MQKIKTSNVRLLLVLGLFDRLLSQGWGLLYHELDEDDVVALCTWLEVKPASDNLDNRSHLMFQAQSKINWAIEKYMEIGYDEQTVVSVDYLNFKIGLQHEQSSTKS